MPLPAIRFDTNAKYNLYYKMYEYKAHFLLDTDLIVPLARKTTEIMANDNLYFFGLWLDARNAGIHPEEMTLDGQYDSFETYAFIEISGAQSWIHIPED